MRSVGLFYASLFIFLSSIFIAHADNGNSTNQFERGKALYDNQQYEEAINTFEIILVEDPSDNNAKRYLSKSQRALTKQNKTFAKESTSKGIQAFKYNNYQEAHSYFQEALIYDPSNHKAQKYLNKTLAAMDATPETGEIKGSIAEARSNISIAKSHYREGRKLFYAGYLDLAEAEFRKVLTINPYHIPARRYLEAILEEKDHLAEDKQRISEREMMKEVRDNWLPPVKDKVAVEVKLPWKTATISAAREVLLERADQIIPTINFNNARLSDVIRYLSQVTDINIVIDESALLGKAEKQELDTEPDILALEGEEDAGEPAQMLRPSFKAADDRITISLKDVPLLESLKYILRAKGLRYVIEDYAIIIVSADFVPPEDMLTRYYHLASGVGTFTSFDLSVADDDFGEGGEGDQIAETTTIKDILRESGVPWPEGSQIFLDQRTGTLIVRNTPTNLEIVEDILRALDVSPFQVMITARFVELENTDASELGIEWLLRDDLKFFLHEGSNNGLTPASSLKRIDIDGLKKTVGAGAIDQTLTGNLRFLTTDPSTGLVTSSLTGSPNPILSISGILTRPEFSAVIHALDQKGKNNILSSPQVTTINGQRAQIKVVQEYIYPTEYEVTPATTNSQGTVLTPPVVAPGSFETRDIGIVLDVTPNVGADRKTINLTIIPEVSEFVTWLDYGVPTQIFTQTQADGTVVQNTLPGFPILQPLFSSRVVTTSVIVNDGDTVVLGGLIRDSTVAYEDKIPFLGDLPVLGYLFRKKGEISVKKNLVIFVSAELLTPTGDAYAPTQIEPGETVVPTYS